MQVAISVALFTLLAMSFGGWIVTHNHTLRVMPGDLPVATKAETVLGLTYYALVAILFAWSCWAVHTSQPGIPAQAIQGLTAMLGALYAVPVVLTASRLNGAVVSKT